MRRVFVYEMLSGGGPPVESGPQAAELLAAGTAMRDAIVADLAVLPEVAVTYAVTDFGAAGEVGATRDVGATRSVGATRDVGAVRDFGARAAVDAPARIGAPAQVAAAPEARRAAGAATRDAAASPSQRVAPRPGEAAVDFVRRMAAGHDLAWIVAPETDGALAALQAAVGAARWIGCSAEAIRIASSKRATLAALAAHGVATPLAFAPPPGGRARWVVKPDDGAGACDTRVHADATAAAADLKQRQDAGRAATLEPWVEGEALSIALIAGDGGVEAVAFNRQDIDIASDGALAWRGVHHHAFDPRHDPRAARLHALAAAVGRALPGLRGFVGIDVVWHAERGPVAVEVNPRVTCAYVGLSATLRRNLAADVLARHARTERVDVAA